MEPLRPSDPRAVGPWKLQSRIGSGGMGEVYLAKRGTQLAALKIVANINSPEKESAERFKRELANLRQVSGTHVAALYDADMKSVPAWIAFEYIDGLNLKQHVERKGCFSEQEWLKFAVGLLKGIAQVHSKGIVHRDLKPTNILLCDGEAKLIDFGIAQALDDTRFTTSGITGTPTWMAPEQVRDATVDKPADLFVAGAVLLYAATGRLPWGSGTVPEIQARIIQNRPDLLGLSSKQRRVISALLHNNPVRRPSAETAVEIVLGSVLADPINWWRVVFYCSGALLAIVGLWFRFSLGGPAKAPQPEATAVIVETTVPTAVSVATAIVINPTEQVQPPTVSPTAVPLVAAVPVAIVQADRLNVRAKAAPDGAVAFVALRDEILYVTGDPTEGETVWLPVYGIDRGYGWVAQRFVDLEDRPASGVDYAIWLEHVHPRTTPLGAEVFQGANVISALNAQKLHQSALLLSGASPNSIVFSPDGSTLAAGSTDGTVWLVALPSGPELFRFAGHTSLVSRVAFSPDGKTLASGSLDSSVRLWDVAGKVERMNLVGHSGIIVGVAFSPDGRVLASTSGVVSNDDSDRVRLWDVKTGSALGIIDAAAITSLVFLPDGESLATAGGRVGNNLNLWSLSTRRVVRSFDFDLFVWSIAISPDGKVLAGAADRTIRLWEVATGRTLSTLTGHMDLVQAVAFSPDGNTLVSASSDTTIKLWEVATGRELRTLNGHEGEVMSVTFSPDGKTLASGSQDGTVRLWDDSEVLPVYELGKLEGKPSRWDPCAGPISVAINFGSLIPAQRKQIEVIVLRSIATINRHSGLEFVYSGPTLRHFKQDYRKGRNGNDAIVIDFVPSYQMRPNVLEHVSPSINPFVSSREWWNIEAADIQLDAELDFFYWPDHGWGDSLILRRLLEASGLKGVNSEYEVMQITTNVSERFRANEFFHMNLELGPGDILGLHAVGAEQGCIVK